MYSISPLSVHMKGYLYSPRPKLVAAAAHEAQILSRAFVPTPLRFPLLQDVDADAQQGGELGLAVLEVRSQG